jgi:hypothetical protein
VVLPRDQRNVGLRKDARPHQGILLIVIINSLFIIQRNVQ